MNPLWSLSSLSYATGGKVLVNAVSLDVHPGKVTGLLGPNGAGKSTLLRLATGLLAPDAGEVLLNNRALAAYPRADIARHIAVVPQDTHIEFDFTAREIVLMGRNPYLGRFQWPAAEDHAIVAQAMEQTHTSHLASQPVTTLSGGERQRIFLARALASRTPFLALDEPAASLDLEHALNFLHLLRKLAEDENRGILMAMHDLNWAARYCDIIVLIDQGTIVTKGSPREVLVPEIIQDVFRVRANTYSTHESYPIMDFEPLAGGSRN